MSDFFSCGVCAMPSNFGPLHGSDGNARILGPCGDTMEFWISVSNGIIDDARYTSDGCFNSNKAGSTAAILMIGKTPEQAECISAEKILESAQDINTESSHCAILASDTLRATIANWRKRNHAALRSGEKKQAQARSIVNPRPHLLVSCRGKNGQNNALVVAYAGNCSLDPSMVMIGIVPSRHSYSIIKETSCFVVNLVSPAQKEMYEYLGSHSGSDGDKFAAIGVKTTEGLKINAPLLSDCPINIECTVVDSIRTGTHEMFIGKIEYVHADCEILTTEGTVDWNRLELI